MTVKNYKVLCDLLGEDIKKGGKSKTLHIKDMGRYFNYEKKGNSFIINEIYEEPLPPNNNITQYIPLIEKLIMHLIITESNEENRLYIPRSKLLESLKMVNKSYTDMKYRELQLKTKSNVPLATIKDFYQTSDDLLKRNVESALDKLNSYRLVHWNYTYSVCELVPENAEIVQYDQITDEYGDITTVPLIDTKLRRVYREATTEEIELILKLEHSQLAKMGYDNISEVYKSRQQNAFYNPIKQFLRDEYRIEHYYQSYSIIYNLENVKTRYDRVTTHELDVEYKKEIETMLNNHVFDKIIDNGDNRYLKAILGKGSKRKIDNRLDGNYNQHIKELAERLILIDNGK